MYMEHIACWFRKWGQPPFGIRFPRNQSLLVHQTSRCDKLRQIQQVITSIPFLNLLLLLPGRITVSWTPGSRCMPHSFLLTLENTYLIMLFSWGIGYKVFLNMAFFKVFFYSLKSPMPKNHMKLTLKKKTKGHFVQIKCNNLLALHVGRVNQRIKC